ncbi:unnamed protein product [Caenorhabditis brenneri]
MAFYNNPEFNGTNYDERGKPKFSQLPPEILTEILKKLDPAHRLISRHVCKRLRSLIDAQKEKVKKLAFHEDQDGIKIVINETNEIRLSPQTNGGCTVIPNDSDGIFIKGACHVALALDFMKTILSNTSQKRPLHTLLFDHSHNSKMFNYCMEYLSSNCPKLHTSIFAFRKAPAAQQQIRLEPLLTLVCTKCLKVLRMENSQQELVMNLMETEHFRQTLMVNFVRCEPLDSAAIDRFFHLQTFIIHLQRISIDMILRLKNEVAQQPDFDSCEIDLVEYLDLDELAAVLGEEIHDDTHISHRFPIGNSKDYLVLMITEDCVEIDREEDL